MEWQPQTIIHTITGLAQVAPGAPKAYHSRFRITSTIAALVLVCRLMRDFCNKADEVTVRRPRKSEHQFPARLKRKHICSLDEHDGTQAKVAENAQTAENYLGEVKLS